MAPKKHNLTTSAILREKKIDSPPPKHLVIIFIQYVQFMTYAHRWKNELQCVSLDISLCALPLQINLSGNSRATQSVSAVTISIIKAIKHPFSREKI